MKNNSTEWRSALKKIAGLRVKWNEPLSRHTSFKIGGPADAMVWAETREQLQAVVKVVRDHGVRLLTLGRGSNLLVSDAGFRGIVLKLGAEFEQITFEGTQVRAGAAVPMSVFSKECAKQGLSGVEFLFGIPGSLGGGVRMNAGAHGSCFADVLVEVEALDWEGVYRRLDRSALGFVYRDSNLKDYVAATEVVFALRREAPEVVEERTKAFYHQRRASQPLSLPTH